MNAQAVELAVAREVDRHGVLRPLLVAVEGEAHLHDGGVAQDFTRHDDAGLALDLEARGMIGDAADDVLQALRALKDEVGRNGTK